MLVVSEAYWAITHRHWLHTDLFVQTWTFFPLLFIFFVLFTSVDNDCSCSSGPEGKQRCKIGQLISHLRATSSSRRPTKFAPAHAHTHTHEQAVDKLCDASMFCLMELYSEWGKGRSIEGEHAPIQAPAQTCRHKHKRGEQAKRHVRHSIHLRVTTSFFAFSTYAITMTSIRRSSYTPLLIITLGP